MCSEAHFGLDLHHRKCGREVSHAHQIVGRAGEGEDPIRFANSTLPQLAHQRNRLQPAEAFFDSLPLSLADGVARVPRRASIDRAAARPFVVLPHMRRHVDIPALGHESLRVESLVSAHRHRLRARQLLQHDQRRIAFCRAIGLEHFRGHDQPVAVLHQQIPAVTQLRLLARPLARQLRLGICLRFVGIVGPLLAVKVYRRIAQIIRRRPRFPLLIIDGLSPQFLEALETHAR